MVVVVVPGGIDKRDNDKTFRDGAAAFPRIFPPIGGLRTPPLELQTEKTRDERCWSENDQK